MVPEVLEAFDGGERGEMPVEQVIGSFQPIGSLGDEHSSDQYGVRDKVAKQPDAGEDAQGGIG